MQCFPLIHDALNDLYPLIPGSTDEAKEQCVGTTLQHLRTSYGSLSNGSVIDYSSREAQFAYLFGYLASHVHVTEQLIHELPELECCLGQPSCRVSCLGAGPGSEFLGMLKHLEAYERSLDIQCVFCDREKNWGPTWGKIQSHLYLGQRTKPCFKHFDILKPSTWPRDASFLNANVITMSYMFSEIYRHHTALETFFTYMAAHVRPDTLLLYIDNDHSAYSNAIDDISNQYPLRVLKCGAQTVKVASSDKTAALGKYYRQWNIGTPKLTTHIAYRLFCFE